MEPRTIRPSLDPAPRNRGNGSTLDGRSHERDARTIVPPELAVAPADHLPGVSSIRFLCALWVFFTVAGRP